MQTKTRMNVYFEPGLLKQVEALALRRNVSKSAVIEAAVASFLSEDSAERLEAVFARRMDRLGRQIDCMDEDLAILGETVSLCVPKTLSELMTWWNRLNWRNDRAALFLSCRLGLTI